MNPFFFALLYLFLAVNTASAETVTVIVPSAEAAIRSVATAENSNVVVLPADKPAVEPKRDIVEIHIKYSPMGPYDKTLDGLKKFYIQAGSDFRFPMQWRYGNDPEPFPTGYWPTATLRTARSPAGIILATYTISIDDESAVKWSLRLSAAQTAALSGKTGYTELSIPYVPGVYNVFMSILTEIHPCVTP